MPDSGFPVGPLVRVVHECDMNVRFHVGTCEVCHGPMYDDEPLHCQARMSGRNRELVPRAHEPCFQHRERLAQEPDAPERPYAGQCYICGGPMFRDEDLHSERVVGLLSTYPRAHAQCWESGRLDKPRELGASDAR